MDCLVLSTDSEKLELRLCRRGCDASANVDALPNKLFRMGDEFCIDMLFAMDCTTPFEGFMIRGCSVMITGDGDWMECKLD